jgi:two-component system sensor histidine kinase HydH
MIAGVIRLNAKGAVLSQEVVEEIIQTFLGNTARFVDYLDDVEPFSPDELAAFAALDRTGGVQTRAAEELGISERVLRYKMGKHKIRK